MKDDHFVKLEIIYAACFPVFICDGECNLNKIFHLWQLNIHPV